MKKNYAFLVTVLVLFGAVSCKKDKKPPTIPIVTTLAATDVTTTTATLHGQITDAGNAEIIESGFVYSSTVGNPTTAAEKVIVMADDDILTATLEGLTSGVTYYVRAFATNSKGTGYGEAVHFETGNDAPTAKDITISGHLALSGTLTARYSYEDADEDPEGTSVLQWYLDSDGVAGGETAITGANSLTFQIPNDAAYQGKFITFGITPKAASGVVTGAEVKSSFIHVVTSDPWFGIRYGIIVSPVTGRKWLDKNLGAANVPTAYNDWQNGGDLFQWGRITDGHQLITRNGPDSHDNDGVWIGSETSGTIGDCSSQVPGWISLDVPSHTKFIIVTTHCATNAPYDWRNPQNETLWQGVNGINNPCPTGWRLPTKGEFEAENLTSGSPAYNQLKFNVTGRRDENGFINSGGGYYWTSTAVSMGTQKGSYVFGMDASSIIWLDKSRANAYAVRCIKD